MTTATLTPSPLDGIRLKFGGVLRSEWIKLRSLRSTVWCLGLVVLLTVGFGLLLALTLNTPEGGTLPDANQHQLQVLRVLHMLAAQDTPGQYCCRRGR